MASIARLFKPMDNWWNLERKCGCRRPRSGPFSCRHRTGREEMLRMKYYIIVITLMKFTLIGLRH